MNEAFRRRIHAAVRRVPRGKVATYGQIARLAGLPGRSRLVGRVLGALKDGAAVPWHRVLGASGRVSARGDERSEGLQRARLAREGVVFRKSGRVDLERFRWRAAADPAAESFRRGAGF